MVRWSLLALVVVPALAAPTPPAYPDGFRSWNHVKSMTIGAGHPLVDSFGGTHHVYVNDVGLAPLQAGRDMPDGAVFVFDLLAAESSGGATVEGARKFTAVMVKDAAKYPSTGGWGFEAFAGDGRERVVKDGGTSCFTCHAAQGATDHLFTRWRP